MSKKVFLKTIASNLNSCRTEVEISDETGRVICVVFENKEGWHTELLDKESDQSDPDFAAAVRDAKESLCPYVNRRGDDSPDGLTAGGLALWLMEKQDGTAMGLQIRRERKSQ